MKPRGDPQASSNQNQWFKTVKWKSYAANALKKGFLNMHSDEHILNGYISIL